MSAELQRFETLKEPRDRGSFRWGKFRFGSRITYALAIYTPGMARAMIEIVVEDRSSDRRRDALRLRQAHYALRQQLRLRERYTYSDAELVRQMFD